MPKLKKIIITSGPTREFIDPIRFLSNPSSGKMGHAIARAALSYGLDVVYITGPISAPYNFLEGAKNVSVISTEDMLAAVRSELISDSALIMAAAPADYKPENRFDKKLKKTEAPSIRLIPNPDILTEAGLFLRQNSLNVKLIGFAAETHNGEEYARNKLIRKNLDLIFLNDLTQEGAGFNVDTNILTIFRKNNTHETWPADSKENLGKRIISEVLQLGSQ